MHSKKNIMAVLSGLKKPYVGTFVRHFSASHVMLNIGFNPFAVRKAKIVHNFGLSECNRVKVPNK